MTNDTKTPAKKTGFDEEPALPVTAETLLENLSKMTPEERHKAERLLGGIRIPARPKGNPNAIVWAYRCTHCEKHGEAGKYALEFLGDVFVSADGKTLKGPPLDVPFEDLPWQQLNGKHQTYDRNTPHCQHCGNMVQTSGGEGGRNYIFRRAMVNVADDKKRVALMLEKLREQKGKIKREEYSTLGLEHIPAPNGQ